MSKTITQSNVLTFTPTGFADASNLTAGTGNYVPANGYHPHTYTNSNRYYARWTTSNTAGYVYYTFSISGIPNDATIKSVSCTAKIYVNSTSYVANTNIQLYSNTTAKGSSVTFASTTNTNTVILNTGDSWTLNEVNNIRLRFGAQRNNNTGYIYFAGATLTITYEIDATVYEVTSILSTDNVDNIEPAGVTDVISGDNYTLSISANSIDDVIVIDNDIDVTAKLSIHDNVAESNAINATSLDDYNTEFSSATGSFHASSTNQGPMYAITAIGYTAESPNPNTPTSTAVGNYVYVKDNGNNTTTGSIIFRFDFSSIPVNATIKSVSIKVYGAKESDTGTNAVCKFGVYSNNTLKGSEQNITNTSNAIISLSDPGTWTRTELQNATLKFTVGYYGGRLGGITWLVEYEVTTEHQYYWTYTLNNVTDDHEIEVGDNTSNTRYLINTSIRTNGCSVNNTAIKKKEGSDFTLVIHYSDISNLIVTDNGSNINSLITGSSGEYDYALTNILEDHNIIIIEKSWYEVTIQSLYENATVSVSNNKVYEGNSFTATINVSNISLVKITDNGENVTSSFIRVRNGVYRASYSNTSDNHEFIVVEANSYSLYVSSATDKASISPDGSLSISAGQNQTFIISSSIGYASDAIILKDNSIDVTNKITNVGGEYRYVLSNVNESHTISLYEVFVPDDEDNQKTYHSISISSINATTTPTNGTLRVEEGTTTVINVIPSEPKLTLATDNGIDITDKLTEGVTTYTIIEKVAGASYGFELNNSTGYYVSTNKGVAKSASVARINFNIGVRSLVTIQYINYAEENYDYGMFGKIDTAVAIDGLTANSTLKKSSPSDSTDNYQLAMASNSASTQTITYTIDKGEHFIDVKFGKDDATDSNNDTLQWKILSIEALENIDITYNIQNINEDHSLIFVYGDTVYYTVNLDSIGCATYPSGNYVVLPNESFSLAIIPRFNKHNIEAHDNGRDITKNLEYFETDKTNYYLYTIKKTNTDHYITIICTSLNSLLIKANGSYSEVVKVFVKTGDYFIEYDDYDNLFESNKIYMNK